MSPRRSAADAVPPWTLALGAMLSVQLGSALSVPLIGTVGAAGTAWLRLSFGAVVFLVLARPPLRSIRRVDVPALVGLGVISGLVTICFLAAIERIPLGTAVAVEFLGPLVVAAIRSHNVRALVWPGLALVGVVGLTEPWQGTIDPLGLGFAVLGAAGWAGSIVLTQRVGDRFTGVSALSMTVPIAALTAAVVGVPQAAGHLSLQVVATAAGLALLFPVLQYALDLLALRRMTPSAFGTLMALEPAIGLVLGLLVLSQHPSPVQLGAIALVVLAGAGAQRGARRLVPTPVDAPVDSPADAASEPVRGAAAVPDTTGPAPAQEVRCSPDSVRSH